MKTGELTLCVWWQRVKRVKEQGLEGRGESGAGARETCSAGFGEDFAAGAVPIELAAGLGDAAAGAVVEIGDASGGFDLAFGVVGVFSLRGNVLRSSTFSFKHTRQ
jgi:hypothetical protein